MVDRRGSVFGLLFFFIAIVSLAVAGAPQDKEEKKEGNVEIIVRSLLRPEGTARVGERIVWQVDVLAKDSWASLPRLPQINLSGAIVYTPSSQSVRLTETIEGSTYTGQRYEWWVYAKRPGKLTLPETAIDVVAKSFGVGAGEPEVSRRVLEQVVIEVKVPPGLDKDIPVVSADELTAHQSWDPAAVRRFKVGDGISRRIERTLSGAPALMLPPVVFADVEGVRQYRKQPELNDRLNRGELVGSRSDSVTLVFERAGDFELPAVIIDWWEPASSTWQQLELPGIEVVVDQAGEVADVAENEGTVTSSSWAVARLFGFILGPMGLAGLVFYFARRPISDAIVARRESRFVRERVVYRQLLKVVEDRSPGESLRHLHRWIGLVLVDDPAPQMGMMLHLYGDEAARRAWDGLCVAVDASDSNWDGGAFGTSVRQIRKRWRQSLRIHDRQAAGGLPKLNG